MGPQHNRTRLPVTAGTCTAAMNAEHNGDAALNAEHNGDAALNAEHSRDTALNAEHNGDAALNRAQQRRCSEQSTTETLL